jgi:hypothetical protein
MKTYFLALTVVLSTISCKNKPNNEARKPIEKELTIAEKIGKAHGFDNWKNVKELAFTFNVDRDSSHFERTWIWKPKTNHVTSISKNDTISFYRKDVDSLSLRADQGFINDKFWLLPAFQLLWDKGVTVSEPIKAVSNFSKDSLNKITLTYNKEGGYTPGDAYDIYFDENFILKEWIFRKENQEKPSMLTAFSNYKTINNISFPTKNTKTNGNWALHFTDVKIKTE